MLSNYFLVPLSEKRKICVLLGDFGRDWYVHPVGTELLPGPLLTAKATENYSSRAR